ncbi:MAG: protein rep [Oscillospiraceae bacterium]|nr:protein rep [Oscillospiraceae bacterium]
MEYIEFLYDSKPDSIKEVDWRLRRLITLRLAQSYKRTDSGKYNRIVDCAAYLEFRRYVDNSLRLRSANFCQTRLCPTCNWRRSKKIFAQVSKIMGDIENDYSFIFLTLTCKNVSGTDLENQIDKLMLAFKKLCKYKHFQSAVLGWCRCFEITHNWKSREYHPHYHCVLAVSKSYFTSDLYISQDEFCTLWQSSLGVDYKPIVDVRAFTDSEKGEGKEIAEVAKYTIKSSNIMANLQGVSEYSQNIQDEVKRFTDSITDDIVTTLDKALANRRLIGYGGIFKQKHKELNLIDDDDLIHTGVDETQNALNYELECYRWDIRYRNYIKIKPNESE